MSIHTDQATVDRWIAAGQWVEFAESPVDWTEPAPCETCGHETCSACGYSVATFNPDMWDGCHYCNDQHANPNCDDCKGSGKQRLAVQVPCEGELRPYSYAPGREGMRCDGGCAGDSTTPASPGFITVARAIQEWGPAPIVDGADLTDDHRPVCTVGPRSLNLWHPDRPGWPYEVPSAYSLPPDVDPASLIGQFARGGRIEAT